MTGFYKPDATGRSTGKRTGRARKAFSAPNGNPWTWLTRELLVSPAWQAMSLTARRFMDFLLIEQINHAATENGNLMATEPQLIAFGISRRLIPDAIDELEFLGLVRIERGRLTRGGVKWPNLYRLTFAADSEMRPPTNEWKGMSEEAIRVWKKDRSRARRKAPLRGDIEVPPKSGGGKTADHGHLTLVAVPPESGGGKEEKVGVRK